MFTYLYCLYHDSCNHMFPNTQNFQKKTWKAIQKRYNWSPAAFIIKSRQNFQIRSKRLMNKLSWIGNSLVRSLFLFTYKEYKELVCVSCFINASFKYHIFRLDSKTIAEFFENNSFTRTFSPIMFNRKREVMQTFFLNDPY